MNSTLVKILLGTKKQVKCAYINIKMQVSVDLQFGDPILTEATQTV